MTTTFTQHAIVYTELALQPTLVTVLLAGPVLQTPLRNPLDVQCADSVGFSTSLRAIVSVSANLVCVFVTGYPADQRARSFTIACPLGVRACISAVQATECIKGWSIDSTGKCVASGPAATCVDGQYWDGSGCSS